MASLSEVTSTGLSWTTLSGICFHLLPFPPPLPTPRCFPTNRILSPSSLCRGYTMKFGLYEVDFDTQERKLRDGSKAFQQIVQAFS